MIGLERVTRVWRSSGACAIALLLTAHVGTDDVFFAGDAGPWHVRVSIRQPGVIPGLADISVRVSEPGVERVTVTARQTREGGGQAPPPDEADRVRGEDGLFAAQLWLMVRGSHEVIVTVDGAAGRGVARIPVVAAASKQLKMGRGLEIFVFGGGLFLVLGLLTIVGAASRESVLPAGEQPARADRVRSWRAMSVATVLLALVLFGGWTWVREEARAHRARLDRPWASEAAIRSAGGERTLELAITEPLWVNRDDATWRTRNNRYRRADLIPDHGKMMHMFLVREPDLDAFAHIHPDRLDDNRFEVPFPPLPAGTYRVYADITHEDGFSHTLATTVTAGPMPETGEGETGSPDSVAGTRAADPDDAWWTADGLDRPAGGGGVRDAEGGTAEPARNAVTSRLADGSVMRWLNADERLVAGADADIEIRVEDAAGRPVALDPYMGMGGHAMLNRSDGEVFIHLHPTGMISMAAQAMLTAADAGMSDMSEAMDMAGPASRMTEGAGVVRFPLIVPAPGRYRLWIQVRRGERVLTGSFDAVIAGPVEQ